MKNVEFYIDLIKERLSETRFNHSIKAAEMCRELAAAHNYDPEKAYLVGILHDICKEIGRAELRKLALSAMLEEAWLDPVETEESKLWHGPAGALYIRDVLEIEDKEIYSAVRFHTSGRADMSVLEKIVYLGDIVEQSRKYPHIDMYRKCALTDLNRGMYEALNWTLSKNITRDKRIARHTYEAYNFYCKKVKG